MEEHWNSTTITGETSLSEVGFLKLRKIKSSFKNRGKRGYYGVVENISLPNSTSFLTFMNISMVWG